MSKKKPAKRLVGKQWLPDPMYDALDEVIKLCGLQGESGTEEFYYMLRDILEDLDGTIEKSHEDGLCYDMCAAISHELAKRSNEQIKKLN